MAFLDLAKKRYSSRKYQDKPVEKEKINYVLEAAQAAPSAKNLQPLQFIVVSDQEPLAKAQSCYGRSWIKTAPVIIIICGDHRQAWRRGDGKGHADIDAAIAIDHMTLAATDTGLATCWVCKFDAMKCSELFELPEGLEPIAMLPLGYPDDQPATERHNKRKPLDELVHWDHLK
jgi:nitroreductase